MNPRILQQCEEMIKKGSSSFYRAFAGLPSPRKEAVYVIYAFCRMIDDSVDEPERSPYSIHELRSRFIHLDAAEGHFIWPALRWLFARFPHLSQEPFLRQMDGQLLDLCLTKYETMDQLKHYCYLVAGTVGEMLLPVLRDDDGECVREAGISLGIGMQLVNITRDVGEDLRRGRRYIPLEVMNKHGYTVEELEQGVINEAFISVLDELKQEALEGFKAGMAGIETYPASSGLAVELAAGFYAGILEAVRQADYDVFNRRAFVTDEAKRMMFNRIAARYAAQMEEAGAAANG